MEEKNQIQLFFRPVTPPGIILCTFPSMDTGWQRVHPLSWLYGGISGVLSEVPGRLGGFSKATEPYQKRQEQVWESQKYSPLADASQAAALPVMNASVIS